MSPLHWTAIFRRIRLRDVGWMVVFAALNVVITFGIGYGVMRWLGANANPAVAGLTGLSSSELTLFFLKTIPHLFGEELLTVLPLLALLQFLYAHLKVSRKTAMIGAWLVSAVIFGMAHLPTYGWNLFQCIVVIGSARLILTLPYLLTKSIWASTGAHILNDWALFGFSIFLAGFGAP